MDKNGFMHICVMIPHKFKVPPLATSGSEWCHRVISGCCSVTSQSNNNNFQNWKLQKQAVLHLKLGPPGMMMCFTPTELRLYVHLASYPGSFSCYPMRESQSSCQTSTKALSAHFSVICGNNSGCCYCSNQLKYLKDLTNWVMLCTC